jgi:hypothetical protein
MKKAVYLSGLMCLFFPGLSQYCLSQDTCSGTIKYGDNPFKRLATKDEILK